MNPHIIDLCRLLDRAVKQRSRLDAALATSGRDDEVRAIEMNIITAVNQCRTLIDEAVRFWDLPCNAQEPPF